MQETKADKIVQDILSGDYDKHIKDAIIIRMQHIIKTDSEFGNKSYRPIKPTHKINFVPHHMKRIPKVSKVDIINIDGVAITRIIK